jgi:hypothetical protein
MMAKTGQKKRLALSEAVEIYSEQLVQWADATLSTEMMGQLNQNRMKLAQLNNFLGVTLEARSPAAVMNWVRYQMGRRETERAWGRSGFGEQVSQDIGKIRRKLVKKIAKDVYAEPEKHLQEVHMALLRRYAGYLKRWYVAKGGQQ